MSRELEQEPMQRLPVVRLERGEELFLQPLGDRTDPDKLPPPFGGKADHVPSAVAGVPLALDQLSLLE